MIALLCAGIFAAATPATVAADELTVGVLTFGPGDHPFFKFGHNAIWVHDSAKRADKVYNFGTFFFDSPLLIPEFLKGKLKYWLSVEPLSSTLAIYRYEYRTVFLQELALSPQEKRALYDALEANALPENRYYKYDYYLDNCSTRVRDAVERVIGGSLQAASLTPVPMTWRDHTRRASQDNLPVYLGLDIAMGSFIDKPINQWEEMFLPDKVRESLGRVVRDGQPLVATEKLLVDAPNRPPMQPGPPRWHVWFALAGTLLGALFILLARRAPKTLRVVGSTLGGIFGVLGCIFVMFWVATDHQVAHHNENIFLCAPFAVLLWWPRLRLRVALASALLATLGLLFKLFPFAVQHNAEFICFFLPFWWGLYFALRCAALRSLSAAGARSPT